jgi:hypothetical protein
MPCVHACHYCTAQDEEFAEMGGLAGIKQSPVKAEPGSGGVFAQQVSDTTLFHATNI